MTLTTAQQNLLAAAAGGDGELNEYTAATRTIATLVSRGYLSALPQSEGRDRLMITEKGRNIIQGEGEDVVAHPDAAPTAPPLAGPTDALGGESTAATTDTDPTTKAQAKAPTKAQLVRDLLERPQGATIVELSAATGWMSHSVRGFLSGSLKRKQGLTVISEKTDAGRTYRLEGAAA